MLQVWFVCEEEERTFCQATARLHPLSSQLSSIPISNLNSNSNSECSQRLFGCQTDEDGLTTVCRSVELSCHGSQPPVPGLCLTVGSPPPSLCCATHCLRVQYKRNRASGVTQPLFACRWPNSDRCVSRPLQETKASLPDNECLQKCNKTDATDECQPIFPALFPQLSGFPSQCTVPAGP